MTEEEGMRERLIAAIREFVYEATHLSPCRDDGSHDCRISAETLALGRDALARASNPLPIEKE